MNSETIYHLHHIPFSLHHHHISFSLHHTITFLLFPSTTTTFLFPSTIPPHFYCFPPPPPHFYCFPSFITTTTTSTSTTTFLPLEYHGYVVCQAPPRFQKLSLVGAAIFLKCTAQLIKKLSEKVSIWGAIILVEAMENMAHGQFGQQFTMNGYARETPQ